MEQEVGKVRRKGKNKSIERRKETKKGAKVRKGRCKGRKHKDRRQKVGEREAGITKTG